MGCPVINDVHGRQRRKQKKRNNRTRWGRIERTPLSE